MPDRDEPELARRVVEQFGGRFSTEAGIDVAAVDGIERWFLAATLLGNRFDPPTAALAYRTLDRSGVSTLHDLDGNSAHALVDLLDSAGVTGFDLRAAGRLLHLAHEVQRKCPTGIAPLLTDAPDLVALRARFEGMPGWGPIMTATFLRELPNGSDGFHGSDHQVEPMAERAAQHLHLDRDGSFDTVRLQELADEAGLDRRDLEASLIRLALAHHRSFTSCERNDPHHCMQVQRRVA